MTEGVVSEKIILFYKRLVDAGGAERLLVKEFEAFRDLGYDPYILCYDYSRDALFGADIDADRLITVSGIRGLARALTDLGRPGVLCASGHVDVGLASILSRSAYALHIHHPSFMTFNETDKYSLFQRRHFDSYAASNFGAARFREIARSHTFADKIRINLRALLSIWAIRRSRSIFVLSNLARTEKKDLFGVEAVVLYGALDPSFRETFEAGLTAREGRTSERKLRLLTIARLDENKRMDELLRALARLVGAGQEVVLNVVGRGPEMAALRALSVELGLGERVTFLGFVLDEELPQLMREADLFVSIDWADYKLTMYEALSHALPILVSTETESSDELLATGYVHVTTPKPGAVAAAIHDFAKARPTGDPERLAAVLERVTWPRYFRRVAEELHRYKVLSTLPQS